VAHAQDYTRHEIGVGLATESGTDVRGSSHLYSGPSGTYDYNVSSKIALEGDVSYITGYQRGEYTDEGHEWLVAGGLKAGWRFQKFGIFGRLAPGFASFDRGIGIAPSPTSAFVFSRRTHFALQDGATFEYYPSPHSVVRLEAGQTLLSEFDQVILRHPSVEETTIGHVAQHLSLKLAVGYRFGEQRQDDRGIDSTDRARGEVGALYALHIKEHLLNLDLEPDSGAGVWGDYDLSRWLSIDGTIFYLPKNDKQINFQDGGQALEAYLGVRSGFRLKHAGYFVKVRPGMVQFAHTVNTLNEFPTYSIQYGRFTNFALDIGGIVETYPTRHLVLRAEAGNVHIYYREKTVAVDRIPEQIPSTGRASVLLLFGAGVRF
jgi:hypothetical protein